MANRIRISCITKTDRLNPHERISNVGGVTPDGTRWRLTEVQAIDGINTGKYQFYVERPPGHAVNVVVARSAYGHLYLKTTNDGEHPNNLLSLPECPL